MVISNRPFGLRLSADDNRILNLLYGIQDNNDTETANTDKITDTDSEARNDNLEQDDSNAKIDDVEQGNENGHFVAAFNLFNLPYFWRNTNLYG